MNARAAHSARGIGVSALVALTALTVRVPANAAAQSPPPSVKRFDVASVKASVSPSEILQQRLRNGSAGGPAPMMGMRTLPGGRFQASSVTLRQLILRAFEVKDYQLEGGPKWLDTDYFAINAAAGDEATPAEILAMLKALLADRFALRTHADTRQAPVYVLAVARGDRRLESGVKPTTPECEKLLDDRKNATGTPPPLPPIRSATTPTCGVMFFGSGNGSGATRTVTMGGLEIKDLADAISSELAAPVINRTDLSGRFDVTLAFTSTRQIAGRTPGLDPNSNDDTPPPLIGVAVEKQLGLKLEKQIGPLPIVVIENAEHPTPD